MPSSDEWGFGKGPMSQATAREAFDGLPTGPAIPRYELAATRTPHIANDPDFAACMEGCDKLLTVKGSDYTGGGEQEDRARLKNFFDCGRDLGLSPFKILAVYWHKHVTAVYTFLKRGQVESEPIEGRIMDVINYMLLLYKLIAVEKREAARNAERGLPTQKL